MLPLLIFGALGGVARGLVGFTKYYFSYKNVTFRWKYFAMSIGVSSVVGLATVWAVDGSGVTIADGIGVNPAMALIIGYAGGDAIENFYKIIFKKPVIGSVGDLLQGAN